MRLVPRGFKATISADPPHDIRIIHQPRRCVKTSLQRIGMALAIVAAVPPGTRRLT